MNAADFFRAVWPTAGVYCLATPWRIPGTEDVVFRHKTFDTIEQAAAFVESRKAHDDLYLGLHTLQHHKIWNATKIDRKTGEAGAWEVRTQTNSKECKVFFFDLDVGESTASHAKYSSQREALADLIRFCNETGLPKPMVTSSGGGLHVYWLLTDPIVSSEWRTHADKLRQLAFSHGLRPDRSKIVDSATVLRVAGTFNHKGGGKRPVVVMVSNAPVTDTGDFLQLLSDAAVRAGVKEQTVPQKGNDTSGLGSNMADVHLGPPVSLKSVVVACRQVQELVRLRGNVEEPQWFHLLNTIRFVEHGDTLVYKVSEGHPQYTPAGVDKKVNHLVQKGIGPSSCAKFQEVCGPALCEGCAFKDKVKNPLMAARWEHKAPTPVATFAVGSSVQQEEIPDPPWPYQRLHGGISFTSKNKNDEDIKRIIYPHDLYPLRRVVNASERQEEQLWRVVLPRSGPKDFTIEASALYDYRKFVTTMSNEGIYIAPPNVEEMKSYMVAYIAELQRVADHEEQVNHFGWDKDHAVFTLADKKLFPDGVSRPVQLSLQCQRVGKHLDKRGTLERQVELLKFYEDRRYVANQFYILAGLAAPLFHATGQHGVIVNASGKAGASKSTSLYTAAAFWGDPKLYTINGTKDGATARGRNERVSTLANLPICVDEITKMDAKDASDLAMGVTQPGHRIRLGSNSIEKAGVDSYKATIMLATANTSLHTLLAMDNASGTAGSMRVFEIMFNPTGVHDKFEADDYLYEMCQNYGHVGEVFMNYVVQNHQTVIDRVRAVMKECDKGLRISGAERFWSATIATVMVAGEIANHVGITNWDLAWIKQWVAKKQIPYMRSVVEDEYSTSLSILTDYMETIHGNILVTEGTSTTNNNIPPVHRPAVGKLFGHYDTRAKILYLLRSPFRDYCARIGANYHKIVQELSEETPPIITSSKSRRILGAGSVEYAKAQAWVLIIDMNHTEIKGQQLQLVSSEPPKLNTQRKAVQ